MVSSTSSGSTSSTSFSSPQMTLDQAKHWARIQLQDGLNLRVNGCWDQALERFQEACLYDPNNRDARFYRAETLVKINPNNGLALGDLETLTQKNLYDDPSWDLYIQLLLKKSPLQAVGYASLKQYANPENDRWFVLLRSAIDFIPQGNQATDLSAPLVSVQSILLNTQSALHRKVQALKFLDEGCKFRDQGNLDQAFSKFHQAISLDPENRDAHFLRAETLKRINDRYVMIENDASENPETLFLKDALADLECILKKDLKDEPAWCLYLQILSQIHSYRLVIGYANFKNLLDPGNSRWLLFRSQALLGIGAFDAAYEDLKAASLKGPLNPELLAIFEQIEMARKQTLDHTADNTASSSNQ